MTLDKEDKPLIITDGALNVMPNVKTKMHILKNVIGFSKRIGNNRPKVAVLSATEEVLDSIQSSMEAKEITELSKKENLIKPIFIGDKQEIQKCAEEIKFDISQYEIIHEPVENNTAIVAAKLAKAGKIKSIVKGHIHTDILMKEVLRREYQL